MKNLKHIKLFEGFYSLLEAFDASHLNKVFNYIKSKEDKSNFSKYVKAIAGKIDVPATAITDKYFQYLPYKDAIKKNLSMDLVDCKATSIGAFGDPTRRGGKGVAGDVCTKGKLKKSYGAVGRTREYDCPVCNGTGKVNPAGQLKYLKFWLNSEGKFIGVTAVDGVYHANSKDVSQFKQIDITDEIKEVLNTQDRNEATVKAGLEAIESKYELVSGKTKIAMEGLTNYRWRDPYGITIGTYWKDRDGKVYVACGNSSLDYKAQRPVGVKWKEFGSYITQIPYIFNSVHSNMDRGTIKILTDVEEKEDYLYNVGVNFNFGNGTTVGSGFSLQDSLSKSFLSDAEFAIVFDFKQFEDDMISAETKNLSKIKGERTERKTGIIGGKIGTSNMDIRNANIERYTKAISDVDITNGFDKLVKKLPRFFGGRQVLFYLMEEKNFIGYRNTVANLLKFMSAENDEQKKYYSDRVSERIRDVFRSNKDFTDKLDTRFESYLNYLNTKLNEVEEEKKVLYQYQIDIFNKLKELSNKIWEKISNMEVETIEDFEIIYSKITGISNALKAERTGLYDNYGIGHIKYLWNYSEGRRTSDQFLSNWNSYYGKDDDFDKKIQECLNKIDYMIRLVNRI